MSIPQFTEVALPQVLLPFKPKLITPGIVQEVMCVYPSDVIPNPTQPGTEIQLFLPQYLNTFLDPSSSMLIVQCSAVFTGSNNHTFTSLFNGAWKGSFYSLFQRMQVLANSVNVTDNINEVGVLMMWLLKLSMSNQARNAMSWILGFSSDWNRHAGTMGYRIKGPFPYVQDNDATYAVVPQFTWDAGNNYTWPLMSGNVVVANTQFSQSFMFALPVPGSLGFNNPNLYYMGHGNTRISLYTDDPNQFFALPPQVGYNVPGLTGVTTSTTATFTTRRQIGGGLTLSTFRVNSVRFEANIIRLSDGIMADVLSLVQPIMRNQWVTKCLSFETTTQTMPQGSSGMTQISYNSRLGSVKAVLVVHVPTGPCNNYGAVTSDGTAGGTNLELVNFLGKWNGVNPGLGPNTLFQINNVNYPKIGLNPTQYPNETWAYILDALNLFVTPDLKPAIHMSNWLVADPNACAYNPGTSTSSTTGSATTQFWRCCPVLSGYQSLVLNATNFAGATYSKSLPVGDFFMPRDCPLLTQVSPASPNAAAANEFFMYFNFEDQPRPGMISGKNTYDGSNLYFMYLITVTSYAYTIYMFTFFDELLCFDWTDKNVYAIK